MVWPLMLFIGLLINEQRWIYMTGNNGFIRYYWINNVHSQSCDGCLMSVYLMDQHIYWLKAFLIVINVLLAFELYSCSNK